MLTQLLIKKAYAERKTSYFKKLFHLTLPPLYLNGNYEHAFARCEF